MINTSAKGSDKATMNQKGGLFVAALMHVCKSCVPSMMGAMGTRIRASKTNTTDDVRTTRLTKTRRTVHVQHSS